MHRIFVVILWVFLSGLSHAADMEDPLAVQLDLLSSAKLKQIPAYIDSLAELKDPRGGAVLEAMLAGNLYVRKSDKKIYITSKGDDSLLLMTDPLGVEGQASEPKKHFKRVPVNNRMRSQLRLAIAKVHLSAQDKQQRLEAVYRLSNDLTPEILSLLNHVAETEQDGEVLAALYSAQDLASLNSGDRIEKLAAIDRLQSSLQPVVLTRLLDIVAVDDKGEYIEQDLVVVKRAEKAIASIQGKAKFYGFVETTFFGLSLGSVLLLSSIGLAITFGVMGVINMAHGELIMLGAYTTYVVQLLMPNNIEYSLLVAVPAAFLVSGMVGVAIERGVIRFLYGRPLETLLATFGVSLVLQQAVRSIFSPLNRSVETPSWMSGAIDINPLLSLTYNRLYIVVFALVVFFLLLVILKKTTLGLQFRAVAQNRAMARAMGIRSEWVDAMTFGLGSGVAGIAGVALSQLTNVGPNLGQAYIIDSFMVVVFGGVGNLWGTLVSAFSLGIANKFLEPTVGAVLAKILVLVFIILFIQKNPRGLFPQKGRAAE
ncbi:MAG: urea ABC transporter permease subunit UrtB [Pseudomonadales bacterium]